MANGMAGETRVDYLTEEKATRDDKTYAIISP